jgi:hypothetical protein
VTQTHRDLCIDLSGSLTAHSKKGHTQLKIWPLDTDGGGYRTVMEQLGKCQFLKYLRADKQPILNQSFTGPMTQLSLLPL